jgi:hypothetical protein
MSDEPKKRFRGWIGWTAVALFVLYPLSIGPAFWWADADGPFSERWETLNTVYAPLEWLAKVDWFRNAMRWYVTRFVEDRW